MIRRNATIKNVITAMAIFRAFTWLLDNGPLSLADWEGAERGGSWFCINGDRDSRALLIAVRRLPSELFSGSGLSLADADVRFRAG